VAHVKDHGICAARLVLVKRSFLVLERHGPATEGNYFCTQGLMHLIEEGVAIFTHQPPTLNATGRPTAHAAQGRKLDRYGVRHLRVHYSSIEIRDYASEGDDVEHALTTTHQINEFTVRIRQNGGG